MSASELQADPRRDFERTLGELRPRLHRYCARMVGSVFDGEDVLQEALGYSLQEIGQILQSTMPAVKAALHRGRERLRAAASMLEEAPYPALEPADRSLLARYVDRFNARDFDAIRDMLADEVRLEMV